MEVLNKIICMGKSNASNISDTFTESNKKYYERKEIANVLNNYLTDVGSSISSNIEYVNGSIHDYINTKYEKSMFLLSVAESEVISIVNELGLNRSIDYIGLSMEIINHVISNISKPLCYN